MFDCKELAKQAIESGVEPLTLHYEKASIFASSQKIVRTSIWVNSLWRDAINKAMRLSKDISKNYLKFCPSSLRSTPTCCL